MQYLFNFSQSVRQLSGRPGVQSQVESYQRLKKMVLDAALLNTQHYKVRIKDKGKQSRERSNALPNTSL